MSGKRYYVTGIGLDVGTLCEAGKVRAQYHAPPDRRAIRVIDRATYADVSDLADDAHRAAVEDEREAAAIERRLEELHDLAGD